MNTKALERQLKLKSGVSVKGKIKFFSREKGFGFVVADNGTEHFLGVREVVGADLPNNGDLVEFESRNGKKGPYAAKLKIIKSSENSERRDDRVVCPSCQKKVFPKLIHDRGAFGDPKPRKSLCPLCGATVKDFSGCFIATSVYGDFDAPEVLFYRHYRDNVLKTNFLGRVLIKLYYQVSPSIVVLLEKSPRISHMVKKQLDKAVRKESF
ncbi:cold-shock protein [Pseudoalteromonas viridis]|uniref:Cold shock domain-containing protein n=1 Tax=Pseudoalteromonas viridis TaxID=339617 RepID=A0ABX7V0M3_9GAMM|nr:CFI-box-CTERM domain-containing protein [Pseudoalteromonas viridis]QTL34000.1 cold shock domain-containing protein [Pseudoalteromonas viridis]